MKDLDKILHQPVRTRIAAYLATRGESAFSDLKQALGVTDGNLEAHLKKLIGAGYVEARKAESKSRQQTLYCLSPLGEQQFQEYVGTLHALLALTDNNRT